jgi:fucose 4-O-acetylase-like acetyltransferase
MFANATTYMLVALNMVGAFSTALVMLWATHNAIPKLRPIYAGIGALATTFLVAHGFILFDIDNPTWLGYLHVLRLFTWPLLFVIPIYGHAYVRKNANAINSLADEIEKSIPND